MDKYEFNIKVEQIKKLVNKGDYETAMKIADTIDWRRVRSANLLAMVAEIYENNQEYQEAKEVLLLAFERAPIGKRLLYKLAELALKEGNIKEAEDYYREFCDLAPEDPRQYLLRYLILTEKKAPEEQLIHSLERYTNTELDEMWLYELAELYCKAGSKDDCIRTCDKIMLLFGLGKYVDKAMELKVQYAPLTGYQIDLIENRDKYEEKLRAVEQKFGNAQRRMVEDEYDDADEEPDSIVNIHMESDESPYPDMDEDLAASFHQAEVEERLAQAVSQISVEEYNEPESEMEHTKIIRNIRDIVPAYDQSSNVIPLTLQDSHSSIVVEETPENSIMEDPEQGYTVAVPSEQADCNRTGPTINYQQPVMDGVAMESAVSAEPETEEAEMDDAVISNPASSINHLMIEARTPERGLEIAIEALRSFHKENGYKNPVIKITGGKLSGRGVFASSDKIAGKDLVIEEAGDLSETALRELNEVMMKDGTGMKVILIDNPMQIESICQINPGLASMFTFIGEDADHNQAVEIQSEIPISAAAPVPERVTGSTPISTTAPTLPPDKVRSAESAPARDPVESPMPEKRDRKAVMRGSLPVSLEEEESAAALEESPVVRKIAVRPIPAYSAARPAEEEMELRAFVDYACQYASEIDCSINGKSMLALYERIEIMEEDGVPLTRANAEDIIEEAADKAEKFSFKKIFTGLFSSKYDKEGLLILREEHFMN